MKAFLDFEASSLSASSFPIEVGWTLESGLTESHLIRPQPSWTDWDDISEQVHGISRAMLTAEGLPAADAARRLVSVLGGCEVFTDAPDSDRCWLKVLLDTAGLPRMPLLHVAEAYAQALCPLRGRMPPAVVASLALDIVRRAEAAADTDVQERHRAGPDSRRLWLTWQGVRDRVKAG